ncbi:hypothetical protein CHU95_00140 [Niveispirillum lacus]|uniref:OmpA-like domain-containing protein n=1 Tax=Niveispirillum lacus TaxID=1981099 RepID=A0A255ZAM1_9PROT|nr:hypothetical protein [Niveispirillum lacus]OYQ37915.1 hypothetical protein CHU95_00140 [Niveispirillum lacus]
MSGPQLTAYLSGMMTRLFTAFALSLLLFWPGVPADAQNSIPTLPSAPPVTVPARPSLPIPAPPDMTLPPLPATPDQTDIPVAPVTVLPAARYPGAVTGPEPARIPADQSMIIYAAGAEPLPTGTEAVLVDIIARLKARPAERLELRAYATGRADRPTDGRRTALLRVRALRDHLVKQGIDPLRLLVFAEGSSLDAAPGGPPPDRVDLVIRP